MGFVVLLKGADERALPIFIGAAEAQSIALRLGGVAVPRPMTHDLMKNLLDFMECRLKRVEVCDVVEGTFIGKLVIERDGAEMDLDTRPSDAIALALRCAAPIFVAEKVMDEAGRVFTAEETAGETVLQGEAPKHAKKLTPLEALEKELERAIREEKYEIAARLRDEIKKIKGKGSDN